MNRIATFIEDVKTYRLTPAVIVFYLWWCDRFPDKYLSSKELAREYNVGLRTAQRYIYALCQEEMIAQRNCLYKPNGI